MPGYKGIHRVVVSVLILTCLFFVLPLDAQTWTQLSTTGGPPSARAWASAVLDPATNKMIMSSGTLLGSDFNDVWSLSTSGSPQWTQLAPAGSLPPARLGQSGVYDSTNSRIMMFGGGLAPSTTCANDVWVLSNANSVSGTPTWTQLNPTGGPPAPRIFHSAVYDPSSNGMIVFGGNDCVASGGQYYNDVWVLSNANGLGGSPVWTQLSLSSGPSVRQGVAAAYDSVSNRLIVFGGWNGTVALNDVWVLSNANGLGGTPAWTQLAPTNGTAIPTRDFASAVYDPASNRMTVFGGLNVGQLLNDTWTLSFANGLGGTPAWTQMSTSTPPTAREAQTTVYDSAGNRMIIFGGTDASGDLNQTWVLTNADGLVPTVPTLSVFSAHSGNFTLGQAGAYKVTVFNQPGAPATSGMVTVTDTLPGGLTLSSMTGTGWSCTSNTCSRSDALNAGASYPAITVAVNVAANASSPQVNSVSVTGGGSATASDTDSTVIQAATGTSVTAISVAPSSGSGAQQSFAFQAADSLGATDLATMWVWFTSNFGSTANSCLLYYSRAANQLFLLNDAGTAWSAPAMPGTAVTLSNSQCSINAAAANVTSLGTSLTLNLPVTFTAGYAGAKGSYLYAAGSSVNSGWQLLGSWTVAVTGPSVTPVSVTPSSGTGAQQLFALQSADSLGATDLASVWVWFTSNFNSGAVANSCLLYYARAANQMFLLNDAGTAWSSPAAPGAAATLTNSQCSINAAAASVMTSGTTLTLNLQVTFAGGYAGVKSTYMYASGSSANSGWQALGTWTVPATSAGVTAVSVTPSTGSGAQQSFALQAADSLGATDLASVWVWFTSNFNSGSTANSCLLYYARAANQLFLLNDAGTAWSAPAAPGAAVTLADSQCSINAASASVTLSGTTLTLNLPMTFTVGYAGAKGAYLYAAGSSANSGWHALGSWTVPAAVTGVSAVSVTPNSGSGAQQMFAFQAADSLGFADLATAWVWFTSAFSSGVSANSCLLYYARAANQLFLLNDAGTAWSAPATPGAAGTLSNSQCSINAATASVTPSGTTLTLNLPMTFTVGYAGAKSIYMYAAGSSANSGWQSLGTWTP